MYPLGTREFHRAVVLIWNYYMPGASILNKAKAKDVRPQHKLEEQISKCANTAYDYNKLIME